jgi:hypothetical protein
LGNVNFERAAPERYQRTLASIGATMPAYSRTGKKVWKSLKTSHFSVAKAGLAVVGAATRVQ